MSATTTRRRAVLRPIKARMRSSLRQLRERWTFGRAGHKADVLRYAASGEHELCEAALLWEGAAEPLRLQLVRSGGAYEYRIRCERTLRCFFGPGAPINRDGLGPYVRLRAERGLSGVIASSFPGCPAEGLGRLHCFCVAVCAGLAQGRDRRAAALAGHFAQLGRHPC